MSRPNATTLFCLIAIGTLAIVLDSPTGVRGDDATASPTENSATPKDAVTFNATVKPFLLKYCAGCHGAKQQKGERRFDLLAGDIHDDNGLVDFQDILDQLNLSEMPPAKARQPSDAERRGVIRWLAARIERYHQDHKPQRGQAVLRRLNAREYRHTVRDLLHLNMTMFEPTSTFPMDQTVEHLDTVGATLVMSGHLLDGYLGAAAQAIDKALLPLEKPPLQQWVFRDDFRQQPEIDQVHRKTNRFEHMTLYDVVGADKHEGAYGPILAFKEGVPFDGIYEIRLQAEAVNRLHPYDPDFLGTDPEEPLRLGIVAGDHRAGQLHKPQPIEPLLGELELADESKWYTIRVWLDAGYTPRFTFRNGLMDARNLWSRLLKKYPDQFPKRKNNGIVEARFNAIKYGKLPQIHIHEIEIKGPILDAWPTAGQRALLGDDCEQILASGALTTEQTREILTRFLSRAYRRPAREDDVERIMQVVTTRQQAGRSSLEACADGLKAALCSPNFLYLEAGAPTSTAAGQRTGMPLSSSALASRLSYFLWSSMPDQTLTDLAASDALRQPEILGSQVDRMLRDEKSNAFIEGFLGSWLTLRSSVQPNLIEINSASFTTTISTPPCVEKRICSHAISSRKTSALPTSSLRTLRLSTSRWRSYGVEPPQSTEFELVNLSDDRRGGLLGQASVLTVTANGIDTSPVVRGVWILENILGTPPSPPPPDVEPLDPDIRGAKTIRDQLKKHRDVASCNDCHRKIDPLGFALENFDPIGKWRDSYNRQAKVDASGELPNGETFTDIRGLKRILVKHKDPFARAFAEELLAYAIGRQVTNSDRPHVDRLLTELVEREYRLRDLIHLVVASELFRSN